MLQTELEEKFWSTCDHIGISEANQHCLKSVLAPLRDKDPITWFHYEHSLRVGMLASNIGKFIHHEERPLLLAGAVHDLGKCQTCLNVLGRTGAWSDIDQWEIENHVIDGYRLLRGRFDMSAEIMLWHHKFQDNGYPIELPSLLHQYRETTKLLIREYGRIVAIADVYDALHRVNEKIGETRALSSTEIMEKMYEFNPDRKKLITALYEANILV